MPTKFEGPQNQTLALDTLIKLFRASGSVASRLYGPLQRDHGLTESQLGVLEALRFLGPMPQGQLCAKILKSGSNLTTVVDNLERHRLVRRERDADDRRVQIVYLTPEGEALLDEVFPGHVARVTALLGALTAEEQRTLARLCRKLGKAAAAGA